MTFARRPDLDLAFGHRLAQLAAMLRAGITPAAAVEALTRVEDHPRARRALRRVAARVEQGASLSAALSDVDGLQLARETLRDAGGETPAALDRLALYYRARGKLRATARAAMLYPQLLLAALVGLMALLVYVIAPAFENLFREMGAVTLPGSLHHVLDLSRAFSQNIELIACLVALIVLSVWTLRRRRPDLVGRLVGLVPVVGDTLRRMALAEFFEGLALRLSAGARVEVAYTQAASVVTHAGFRSMLERTCRDIRTTGRVSDALRKAPDLVRPLETVLVAAAEEQERDRGTLIEAARQTARHLETHSRLALRVAAPVAVVVVALLFIGLVGILTSPMTDIASSLR
jgi:type IV pilus assembly protein PilC